MNNSLVIARAGGLENLEEYYDKFNKLSAMGEQMIENTHHYGKFPATYLNEGRYIALNKLSEGISSYNGINEKAFFMVVKGDK